MFKQQHSNYWLGGNKNSSFNLASKGSDAAEIAQLASIKTAVTNFVKIVTGRHDIPVKFSSGNQSYTDADQVIISASTDEKTLDAVVGLALHESTHCVWRDFPDFLRDHFVHCMHVIAPQDLLDRVDKLNSTKDDDTDDFDLNELPKLLKTLMNVFEDRRIDWWLYREAPGYRPYYEALYDQYWHSDEIDSALQQGRWDVPTVGNYISQLINMTNPWFDSRSLPGMSEIYKLIDVDNINRFDGDKGWGYARRTLPKTGTYTTKVDVGQPPLRYDLSKMPQIFQLAVGVLGLIFDNAIIANQTSDDSNCDGDDGNPSSSGQSGETDDDMEDNLDTPQSSGAGSGKGESAEGEDSDDDSDDDSDSGSGSSSTDSDDDSDSDEDSDDDSDEDSDSDSDSDSDDDSDEDSDDDSKGDKGDDSDEDSDEKKSAPKPKNLKPINEQDLKDALEKQQQFLDGDVPKEDIDNQTDNQVTAIQQSGAEQVEVDAGIIKTKVLVMNKLTQSILESGVFPFFAPGGDADSRTAVKDGFRMGKVLAHKLAIRNQNQTMRYNRRPRGKIDKRRLSQLGAGDTSVFYNTRTTAFQPVLAHMSIDASGSMNGQKWSDALAVGIAVAVAADTITNLDIVISIRAGDGGYSAYGDSATIAIIYDSREDNPSKIKKLFPFITTAGNTPEGLCFAAILDTLVKEKHGDRYFINLSDGEPWFGQYSGSHAHKHTRTQVNHMRDSGMNILSYFVSSGPPTPANKSSFTVMYGKDASFIDVTKVSSIASTLNKLFLVR